mgnify:CR=1 FL=1
MSALQLKPSTDSDLNRIEELFAQHKFKDYQLHQLDIPKSTMVAWLTRNLSKQEIYTWYLRESGKLQGIISAKPQSWISEMLEVNAVSLLHLLAENQDFLRLNELLRIFLDQYHDFDFMDCRVASGDINAIHTLEESGFHFMGNEAYLVLNMKHYSAPQLENLSMCRRCPEHLWPQVLELSRQVHIHNRYMNDPHINREMVRKVYSGYISEFGGIEPYRTIIYEEDNLVTGFVLYKWNHGLSRFVGHNYASLDFIGVDPNARCRGIGHLLNTAALNDLAANGADHVVVRTLGNNFPAIRILSKSGFEISSLDCHFHYWNTS